MEVDVSDAALGFSGEAGGVVIGHVGDLGVEDIEYIDAQPYVATDLEGDLPIEERRGLRPHAVVLSERPRAEVAHEQAR